MAEAKPKDDEYVLNFSTKPEEVDYFQSEVSAALQPRSREMLLKYTGIPPNDLTAHIKEIQKRSFDIAPYSSVGSMTWLNPMILLHFAYPKVLEWVKEGASILDCGCMIAQDLRQLAYDGAPTDKMHGFDLEPEFFEIGYDFFRDRERFQGQFFQADAIKEFSESKLGDLVGKLDVVWCAKFIHLFDWDDQIVMATKLVKFLKPQKGSMFVGSQNGFPGGKFMHISGGSAIGSGSNKIFLNDVQHVKEVWAEVSKRTGLEFDVEATLLDLRTNGMHKDDGSGYKKITGYNLQYLITIK